MYHKVLIRSIVCTIIKNLLWQSQKKKGGGWGGGGNEGTTLKNVESKH